MISKGFELIASAAVGKIAEVKRLLKLDAKLVSYQYLVSDVPFVSHSNGSSVVVDAQVEQLIIGSVTSYLIACGRVEGRRFTRLPKKATTRSACT